MPVKTLSVLLLFAGVNAAPILAQRPIDERRPATPDGTVKISNAVGSVLVTGWREDAVSVVGELGRTADRLEFTSAGRETRIRVVLPPETHLLEGSQLEVRVPMGSHVAVRTSAADIDVKDVEGAIDLESVSGSITVTGHPRMVYAESAGGDLVIDAVSKVVRARSVDGRVEVRRARGYLEVSTVSGSAEVSGRQIWEGEMTSVTGDISFTGDFDPSGSFYFESHSGSIELRLPESIAADFDVTSLKGGTIENEFVATSERTFSTGGGGTQIRIKSFKGTVRILRM